jgi:hypothetical protein
MPLLHQATVAWAIGLACILLCAETQGTAAKACGCQNMRATSDSPTGTCAVREYRTISCELLWGPDPGAKQASIGFHPPANMVLMKLAALSLNSPLSPAGAPTLPEVERIRSGPDYWREFQGVVQERSRVDADLYSRSLAFLAQQGDVIERPHIAVGAVVFIMAASVLQYLSDLPSQAEAILKALIANRQRLVAFTREKWEGGGAVADPLQLTLPGSDGLTQGLFSGFITFGCVEFSVQPTGIAEMVKAPWTPVQARRCKP